MLSLEFLIYLFHEDPRLYEETVKDSELLEKSMLKY